ncbi:MAG TPA: SprT family zinc-dependent metalloprotease [Syntrophales bacterium]|nr:SprT family zinc-dependent metalloprotease [Syntrophales bacterium]
MEPSYLLVRSKKRKKTISLQVKTDGTILVYAPYRTPTGEIDKFFNEKKKWLKKKIEEREIKLKDIKPREYITGELFLYLGVQYPLRIADEMDESRSLTFSSGQFVLAGNKAHQGSALFIDWYKKRSQEYIEKKVMCYSQALGLNPRGIRISNALCRWGSCSSDNNLSFSWRLIMAPCPVIDYVIVHELTHMKEKNHSIRFWGLVAKALPDYKRQRLWLKENGHLLTAL